MSVGTAPSGLADPLGTARSGAGSAKALPAFLLSPADDSDACERSEFWNGDFGGLSMWTDPDGKMHLHPEEGDRIWAALEAKYPTLDRIAIAKIVRGEDKRFPDRHLREVLTGHAPLTRPMRRSLERALGCGVERFEAIFTGRSTLTEPNTINRTSQESIGQTGKHPATRPRNYALRATASEVTIAIRRKGSTVHNRITLVAIEPVSEIFLKAITTGRGRAMRELHSSGTLTGPVDNLEGLLWSVQLPKVLGTGELYTLDETFTFDDPDASMKPFYAMGTGTYAGYGTAVITIVFKDFAPSSLERYVDVAGGHEATISERKPLFLDSERTAIWSIPSLASGFRYVIRWDVPPA